MVNTLKALEHKLKRGSLQYTTHTGTHCAAWYSSASRVYFWSRANPLKPHPIIKRVRSIESMNALMRSVAALDEWS